MQLITPTYPVLRFGATQGHPLVSFFVYIKEKYKGEKIAGALVMLMIWSF
jgi:hypothetical protein